MISCKPIAGFADDSLGAAGLVWGLVALFTTTNFIICEAIISLKLIFAPLLIFFMLFVSLLIFSSSHWIYSDCSIETLVNDLTFSKTWSSILLSIELALIDFLVRNMSSKEKRLSAASFFKFVHMLGGSKITFDINTCAFHGFDRMAGSKL